MKYHMYDEEMDESDDESMRGGVLLGAGKRKRGGVLLGRRSFSNARGGVLLGAAIKKKPKRGPKRVAHPKVVKMVNNPWITFVKKYAKEHGISYGDAMATAGCAYKKKNGKPAKTNIRKRVAKKKVVKRKKKVTMGKGYY